MLTSTQIIAMAKEAGITYSGTIPDIFYSQDSLERFCNLVFNAGYQEASDRIEQLEAERNALQFSWAGCSQQLKDAIEDLKRVEAERDKLAGANVINKNALKLVQRKEAELLAHIEQLKAKNKRLTKQSERRFIGLCRCVLKRDELLIAGNEMLQSLEYVERVHGCETSGGFKREQDIKRWKEAITKGEK